MIAMERYLERQKEWSLKAFGPGARVGGITKHIEKEVVEVRAAPADLDEWIDIAILALDGAWRAGYSPAECCMALERIQMRNFARAYHAPTSPDEPTEHIRS